VRPAPERARETTDGGCDQEKIVEFAENPVALLQQRDGVRDPLFVDGDIGQLVRGHTRLTKDAECLRARGVRALVGAESSFEATPPLDQMPFGSQNRQSDAQPQRAAVVARRFEPVQGSPEVVVVALQPVEPLCRSRSRAAMAGERVLDTVQVCPRIGMLAPWRSAPLTTIIDG
jgi:hypothetical protein